MHVGKSVDCEELFMSILPNSYNLGPVKKWTTNKYNSYIQKLKAGKHHVETSIYDVPPPKYKLGGKDLFENIISDAFSEKVISVTYVGDLSLEVIPDKTHRKIYITSNKSNPKNANTQREETNSTFTMTTKEDKEIRFCGIDKNGKYSKITTLKLVNEDNKFEAKIVEKPMQMTMSRSDETPRDYEPEIQLTLPKDEESLIKCFRSIIMQSKKKYKLSDNILDKVLRALINEQKG